MGRGQPHERRVLFFTITTGGPQDGADISAKWRDCLGERLSDRGSRRTRMNELGKHLGRAGRDAHADLVEELEWLQRLEAECTVADALLTLPRELALGTRRSPEAYRQIVGELIEAERAEALPSSSLLAPYLQPAVHFLRALADAQDERAAQSALADDGAIADFFAATEVRPLERVRMWRRVATCMDHGMLRVLRRELEEALSSEETPGTSAQARSEHLISEATLAGIFDVYTSLRGSGRAVA